MTETDFTVPKDDLPRALIIAAIKEMEQHGITDLSLRRVAGLCGVSCAAPYRHFRNKEELVLAVIAYINKQWSLLAEQVLAAFADSVRLQLTELCIANVRFWAGNPHFRFIMLMDERGLDSRQLAEKERIFLSIRELTVAYCAERGINGDGISRLYFLLRSLIIGATQMMGSAEYSDTDGFMKMTRSLIEESLP